MFAYGPLREAPARIPTNFAAVYFPRHGSVGRCLNCGAELHGAFCAACGQRAVPPDPTVKELAGDAWQELTGYDGRIAATLRGLLHPGRLTIEYLRGHRATYLPPVRVYLIASLVYFVIAAAAPPTPPRRAGEVTGPVGLRLGLWSTSNTELTDEDRAELREDVESAPAVLRPLLRGLVRIPRRFARSCSRPCRGCSSRCCRCLRPSWRCSIADGGSRRTWCLRRTCTRSPLSLLTLAEAVKFTRNDIVQAIVGMVMVVIVHAVWPEGTQGGVRRRLGAHGRQGRRGSASST